MLLLATLTGPAAAQAPIPDAVRAHYMVKNALVALNNANLTGNYTVLRDLGSPRFRNANDAARLAAIFAPMRENAIDLAPIVVFDPQMTQPVASDEQGRLRLIGYFPTQPLSVVFDLAYEPIGGRWMIADIAVNTVPADELAAGMDSESGEQPDDSDADSSR
jgi:hypothetical protein